MLKVGRRFWVVFSFIIALAQSGLAQEEIIPSPESQEALPDSSLSDLTLGDIFNISVDVAALEAASASEGAGIITIVTEEEIKNSGARDLMDVLLQVPGFGFASDVQGAVGLIFRGNWGHEGKILLLWDGQQMNETLYGNTVFGNHYPVEQIHRIEIIRGPGSASYGGFAELAVVKIISKSAEDIHGAYASVQYGQMIGTYALRNLNLGFGQQFGDLKISLQGTLGQGMRSNRDYTDSNGNTFNFAGQSQLNPFFFNLGINFRELEIRLITDYYEWTDRTSYGVNLPYAVNNWMNGLFLGVKYGIPLSQRWTLTPEFRFTRQEPWKVIDPVALTVPVDAASYLDIVTERFTESLTLSGDLTKEINLIAGLQAYQDTASELLSNGPAVSLNSSDPNWVAYSNYAAYFRGMLNLPYLNFTLGGRYDQNNGYWSAFVPRAALVVSYENTHAKFLASEAFRSPSIYNLLSGVIPEFTRTFEVEVGHQLNENIYFSANAFDIHIDHPIVYGYASTGDSYVNYPETGTRGFEIHLEHKDKFGNATASYSFYNAQNNEVVEYSVPNDPSSLIASAHHKFALSASRKLFWPQFRISPSLIYLSPRWGFDYSQSAGTPVFTSFGPVWIVNLFLSYQDFLTPHLDIGGGIYNILDVNYLFPQAYNTISGQHPPIPGAGRELVVRAKYQLNF